MVGACLGDKQKSTASTAVVMEENAAILSGGAEGAVMSKSGSVISDNAPDRRTKGGD